MKRSLLSFVTFLLLAVLTSGCDLLKITMEPLATLAPFGTLEPLATIAPLPSQTPRPTHTPSLTLLPATPSALPSTHTPTVTWTLTPTPSFTSVPPTSTPTSTGLCDHPYFPVISGAAWSYITQAGESFKRTLVRNSQAADAFTLVLSTSESPKILARCTPQGLVVLELPGASMNLESWNDPVAAALQITGVTLPREVKPGDAWTFQVILMGNETNPTLSATLKYTARDTIEYAGKIGTFPALPIELTAEVTERGQQTITRITDWYVRDIGLVQRKTQAGDGAEQVFQLVGLKLPAP